FHDLVLAAALRHQLHADADAEERPAFLPHGFVQRLDHAGDRIEPAPAVGKRADAGQHDAISATHRVGIAGNDDRLIVPGLARGALERLRRRVQVARAVVDDRDRHGRGSGCGNSPTISEEAGRANGDVAAAGGADVVVANRPPSLTQPSKKRRTASSRSSPTTTPRFSKRRRASFQRSSDDASIPTSSDARNQTRPPALSSMPRRRSRNVIPPISSRWAISPSHSRWRSIQSGASRNAQKWNP